MPGNKNAFFSYLDTNFELVTFDELTIVNETRSALDWRDVDLSSQLSRNIKAPMPILTTPMTTVTESAMAIAAAQHGGGGVIHHANAPDEQKRLVRRVKLFMNGIIEEPITMRDNLTAKAALENAQNKGYHFTTFPVIDEDGRYMGLMTSAQFKLFGDEQARIGDAMLPADQTPTAPVGTEPEEAFEMMRLAKEGVVTLLDEERRVTGLYVVDDVLNVVRGNPQGYNLDAKGRLRTFMSVSTHDGDAEARIQESGKYLDMVVIDTSHGESEYTFSTLKIIQRIRELTKRAHEEHPGLDVMVGNVSDAELARELALAEPDAIRVGRGPGGICISREKLGGGTPQASAIYKCRQAVDSVDPKIAICADGGIRGSGDFVKALALGADSIMVGSFVAGTDEAAAPVMTRADSSRYKEYNGMGSEKEQRRSRAGLHRYDAAGTGHDDIFVEGVEKEIPLQGPVSRKFNELTQGAAREMATGAFPDIASLQREVRLGRVTVAGMNEGRASQ